MTNTPDDLETKTERKWRYIILLVLCACLPFCVRYLHNGSTSTQQTVLNTITSTENLPQKVSAHLPVVSTASIIPTSSDEPIDFIGTVSKIDGNNVEILCCNGTSITTTKPEFSVNLKSGARVRIMAELIKNFKILPDTPEVTDHTHWAFIDELGPRYVSISYFEDSGDVKYGNAFRPPFPLTLNSGVVVEYKDNIEYQIVEVEP